MHQVLNRVTGKLIIEEFYGKKWIELLYGKSRLGKVLSHVIAKTPTVSKLFGALQSHPLTKKKILPFIEKYGIDKAEFEIDEFTSFNDFFIRKLKKGVRPLANSSAIIPADGRYLGYETISEFSIKGKQMNLKTLLQDERLAEEYKEGSLLIARLAPVDYHRFHFPVDCTPSTATPIKGPLYSVNPLAIKHNLSILSENKRAITHLNSAFGDILFIEVGATFVGSIHQTYRANTPHKKGDEKGYFSFGGSSLLLLFKKGSIQIDQDLLQATKSGYETLCKMGQSLGRKR